MGSPGRSRKDCAAIQCNGGLIDVPTSAGTKYNQSRRELALCSSNPIPGIWQWLDLWQSTSDAVLGLELDAKGLLALFE